ncbi:MAG: Uncharacterized protein JWQ69_4163 [Pseudomonas sp.]|nr:Uncharacterized protein [Pseudomonas sp.]
MNTPELLSPPPLPGVLALNPLIIPVMDYGSPRPGLGHDDLNDPTVPVVLHAQLNIQGYRPGFFATLYWSGFPVQAFTLEESHFENGFVGFNVLPIYIKEPQGDVYYSMYDQLSGETVDSDPRTVLVKMSIPGDLDTDTSTPYLNDNLAPPVVSPAEITDPATLVTVTVVPWKNMAEGDELVVMWSGFRLVQPPLLPGQVGQSQVITIPREVLERGDGDALVVNYEIRDIVNNYSLVSLPAFAKVIVDPNAPPAPVVLVSDQEVSLIDLVALGTNNVLVLIPVYPGIAIGDDVTLTWLGRTPDGVEVTVVLGPEKITSTIINHKFFVPNADVVAIAGGSAVLSYSVQPGGGGARRSSKSNTVNVNGVAVQLPAPLVDEANGGLILDPEQMGAFATVRIKPYTGKDFGDVVYLLWEGTTQTGATLVYTDEYSVQPNQETLDITFAVAKSNLEPLANGSLNISYQVLFFSLGKNVPSPITTYSVVGSALLPAPTVDNAPGDVFDPDLNPNGTNVHIDGAAAGFKRMDEVTAFWEGVGAGGTTSRLFRIATDGQVLAWPIAAAVIEPSRNGQVRVRYEVIRFVGGTQRSEVVTLTVATSGQDTVTENFTGQAPRLIQQGQVINTGVVSIYFISGTGSAGFPDLDRLPVNPGPLQLPVFHVCFQNTDIGPDTQTIDIDLQRDCTTFECDVHGVNGNTTIELLDINKTVITSMRPLPTTNFHFQHTTATQPIRFLRIIADKDWTLWDNLVMTV